MIKKLKELWSKYQSKFTVLFSWLRIPLFAVLIGFLGSLGGSKNASLLWRRCGISLVLTSFAYFIMFKEVGWILALWAITFMFYWLGSALGYGQPSFNGPNGSMDDEGSFLGKFWWKVTKGSEIWSNVFTRGTVGLVEALAGLSIPILRQTYNGWIWYVVGAIIVVLSHAMFSWRSWGSFKMTVFNKELEFCYSDIVAYTIQGIGFYIIICFK